MFQKFKCNLGFHKQGEFQEQYFIDTYDKTDVWKSIAYRVYKCKCCGTYFSIKIGAIPPYEKKNYKYKIYPTP